MIKKTMLFIIKFFGTVSGAVLLFALNLFLVFVFSLSIFVLCDWDKYGIKTSLWGCEDKLVYSEGGGFSGDSTDYGEYYFNENTIKKFEKSKKYMRVTESDIDNIYGYFSNFDGWLVWTDYKEKYTFNKDAQINVGDYYYIYNRYPDSPYSNYDLYYVDIDCNTVYYIHGNI